MTKDAQIEIIYRELTPVVAGHRQRLTTAHAILDALEKKKDSSPKTVEYAKDEPFSMEVLKVALVKLGMYNQEDFEELYLTSREQVRDRHRIIRRKINE